LRRLRNGARMGDAADIEAKGPRLFPQPRLEGGA
jgi:hypothetical protein